MSASLTLLRPTEPWGDLAIAAGAVVVLAGLDFAGAIAAKEWSLTGSPRWLAGGLACFLVLFVVYGASLRYAELSMVTMGWIVLLQVGVLVLDRVRYEVALPTGKWVAVVLILLLQGYLLLAPSSAARSAGPSLPSQPAEQRTRR